MFHSTASLVLSFLILTLSIVGCDGDGENPPVNGGSATGAADGGGTPTPSCDLAADNWYSDCDDGCGDVMVCQSFCLDCEYRCMVPCIDSADCEAVGAGGCEESTYGSNRCSGAPTMCPGEAPEDPPGGPEDPPNDPSGDACVDVAEECEVNVDCCGFASGGALCINYASYGTFCGATCSTNSDCVSGCCAQTDADDSVCAPEEFCG